MRRLTQLAVPVSLVAAALCGLVVLGMLHPHAQGPVPPTDGLASLGIRYREIPSDSGFKSGISAERAIEVARQLGGLSLLDPNTQVSARLVLFSDDAAYTENERGEKVYRFRGRPAWVVTFSNVKYPLPGGRRQDADILYATEVNVAIDAVSGNGIETYSWH